MNVQGLSSQNILANGSSSFKMNNTKLANNALSQKNNTMEMIEKIQEQIKKINENDSYDTDTKKIKVEELEKQIIEIETQKREQDILALTTSTKKTTKKEEINKDTAIKKTNAHGDTLEISQQSLTLINASVALENLKSASSIKNVMNGELKILSSEIKLDKERGVDTKRKEEQLSKISENITKTENSIGETITSINEEGIEDKNVIKQEQIINENEINPTNNLFLNEKLT